MMKAILTQNGLSTSRTRAYVKEFIGKPAKDVKVMFIMCYEDYVKYENYYNAHEDNLITAGIRKNNIIRKLLTYDMQLTYEELISRDAVYVCGLSTERLFSTLGSYGLIENIRRAVYNDNVVYIGANAGSIVASRTVNAGFDFIPYKVYTIADTDNKVTTTIDKDTTVINLGEYNCVVGEGNNTFIV